MMVKLGRQPSDSWYCLAGSLQDRAVGMLQLGEPKAKNLITILWSFLGIPIGKTIFIELFLTDLINSPTLDYMKSSKFTLYSRFDLFLTFWSPDPSQTNLPTSSLLAIFEYSGIHIKNI